MRLSCTEGEYDPCQSEISAKQSIARSLERCVLFFLVWISNPRYIDYHKKQRILQQNFLVASDLGDFKYKLSATKYITAKA